MHSSKLHVVAFVLAVALVASFVTQTSTASGEGNPIVTFNTMAPVTGPFVGTANPIRGINGGGLPWAIANGNGVLHADGKLDVNVHGLVLAAGPNTGKNPIPTFRAVVSCLSVSNGNPTTVNVSTDPFAATTTGDAHIHARLALPSPCIAPIIFVTSPTGAWFAATGN